MMMHMKELEEFIQEFIIHELGTSSAIGNLKQGEHKGGAKMEMIFYVCKHCGNIIAKVKDSGVPVVCCGEQMAELVPNTEDAAQEKHVPVFEVRGNLVEVMIGAAEHPMLEEHYIEWIALHTNRGNQRKVLSAGDAPKAEFALLDDEKVEAVYAYCNLHGLWKAG